MTIGTLAAFLLYLRMFFEPMQEITQFFNTFPVGVPRPWRSWPGAGRAPDHRRPRHPVALPSACAVSCRSTASF